MSGARTSQMLAIAIALLLLASALLIGASHVPVALAVGLGSGLCLTVLAIADRDEPYPSARHWVPSVTLALLGLFCFLQACPMPLGWIAAISPQAADVWARSLAPVGQAVTMASVSLDRGASIVEGVKWLGYASVFHAADRLARRRGPELGLTLVVGSVLVICLVSLGHALFDAQKVFGLYEPRGSFGGGHIGPLLNANNLAGYANLGALVGLGLLLARRTLVPQWVIAVAIVVAIGVGLRSASRGGALALLVGLALLAALTAAAARTRSHSRGVVGWRTSLALGGAAVLGGGALTLLGADRGFWTELLSENVTKLAMGSWVWPMLSEYAWLGVGRGAFESAFAAYRPVVEAHWVFTHPENVALQWASEWGLPVTLVAFSLFARCFGPKRVRVLASSARAGAWVGIVVLLLQNLVDLGLELSGVATAMWVSLGTLWGDTARRSSAKRYLHSASSWTAKAIGGGCCVTAVAVLIYLPPSLDDDRRATRDAVTVALAGRGSVADARERIVAAMRSHPADPYFPLLGAVLAEASSGDNPMPWLQRALERGPTVGRTHLVLAQVLARRAMTGQALFELSLATRYEPALVEPAATIAVRLSNDPLELVRSAPDGPAGLGMLNALGVRLAASPHGAPIDEEAIRRQPSFWPARQRLVERMLQPADQHAAGCLDQPGCMEDLEQHLEVMHQLRPRSSYPARARARLEVTRGDDHAAAEILQESCEQAEDRPDCLEALIPILMKLKRRAEADRALRTLENLRCRDGSSCAAAHEASGRILLANGQTRRALGSFQMAASEEPTDERLLRVADLAEAAGAHAEAAEALIRLRARAGDSPALTNRIQENQRRAWQQSEGAR